jgi:hypothetical protein
MAVWHKLHLKLYLDMKNIVDYIHLVHKYNKLLSLCIQILLN